MRFKTYIEYQTEIARVREVTDRTNSERLRRDYGKYLKRLEKEARNIKRFVVR